jgi:cell division protein FtsI (penicillin-binding protein 3)
VTGGYAKDKWTASFVGFVPADDPQLAIVLIVDDPVINYYGGVVAAPTFKRIADRSLRYMGIAPYGHGKVQIPGKDQAGGEAGVDAGGQEGDGAGDPLPGEDGLLAEMPSSVFAPCTGDCVEVPDLVGRSLPWVLGAAAAAGIEPVIEGAGRAMEQGVPPGTMVERGTQVRVTFEPVGW